MKKILVILMLVINSISFGGTVTKEQKDELTKTLTTMFNKVPIYDERSYIEKAEETINDFMHESLFYDYGYTEPITTKRYIAENAMFYAISSIYGMNKNAIINNKITVDEMEKDFKWKVTEDAFIIWYIPKAYIAGIIDLRYPESVLVFGVDTGALSYYADNIYFMYPMPIKYVGDLGTLNYREPETLKFILKINNIKYKSKS